VRTKIPSDASRRSILWVGSSHQRTDALDSVLAFKDHDQDWTLHHILEVPTKNRATIGCHILANVSSSVFALLTDDRGQLFDLVVLLEHCGRWPLQSRGSYDEPDPLKSVDDFSRKASLHRIRL